MNYVAFMLLILLYVYACYLGVRGYWLVAGYLHQKFHRSVTRSVLLHAWFLVFVVVEVPFGIFFPAWLSGRWRVSATEPLTTILLLLFGCGTLGLAAWRGWRGAEARRFSEMLRG